MGNPSYGDDGPEICWNGPKSWESEWYADDSITIDARNGAIFDGRLVGVADWASSSYTGDHKVVIEVPSGSGQNLYLIYNRKKGPNVGVTFAADEVTLTYGAPRQVSWHEAALDVGESHSIANFDNGSDALVIKVCDKTTIDGADTVRVLIYANDADPLACSPPTVSPTASPTITAYPTDTPTIAPTTICGNDVCDVSLGETCNTCWQDCCPNNGATLETWTDIGGTTLSAIDWNSDPNEYTEIRGDADGLLEGPINVAENYGERIRTWLVPPVTGSYTFWIASDDQGSLLLSSDASPDNAVEISRVPYWTNPREFNKYPEQRSASITLVEGTPYFLEAKMKEGGGGDNLAVAWEYPGQTQEVIPASYGKISAPDTATPTATPTVISTPPTEAPTTSPTFNPTDSPTPSPTTADTVAPTLACGNDVCDVSLGETCNTCWQDCCPNNGATLETWTDIGGTTLSAIDWNSDPNEYTEIRGDADGLLEGPINVAENYGERIRTWLVPPVTGSYTFWIASDDQGSLLLSSDASPDNAVEISRVPYWTNPREFNKYPEQRSASITLVEGTPYFLEAKMKEGGGGDNLAVAWAYPGQAPQVIPASYGRIKPPDVTESPTASPTVLSTASPTDSPTTFSPTASPSHLPTSSPTASPSNLPTTSPTPQPSSEPSSAPSSCPDDASWSFTMDCAWVAQEPSERCTIMGTDGRMAKEACTEACDQPCSAQPPPATTSLQLPVAGCLGSGARCSGHAECCSGQCKGDGRCY